ncbi:Uncharacterised protein [Pseudomonas putida]|nr:Uncharacterised protein [Pseudomonas putida]
MAQRFSSTAARETVEQVGQPLHARQHARHQLARGAVESALQVDDGLAHLDQPVDLKLAQNSASPLGLIPEGSETGAVVL